jgi:hypothetical protein
MREIKRKEDLDKKRIRNQIIVGVILIATMLLSTLGFAFFSSPSQDNTQKIKYNNLDFTLNSNNLWDFAIQGVAFSTIYNPTQTDSLNFTINPSINDFYNKPLFFVSDNQEASNEIISNIGRFALRYQDVCLQGRDCIGNLVAKNCSENIIIIQASEKANVYKKDNCIFIEGNYNDQKLLSDKLIFRTIGIQ